MKKIKTLTRDETIETGMRLGEILKKGDVVCLEGNLGAGKTVFTGGIATALGIDDYVTSPTFTIINEYAGEIPLYHFDAYRITDPQELWETGFEEYMAGNGITVIEWADKIKGVLPGEYIWVDIKKDEKGMQDARIISMKFKGSRYRKYERQLKCGGKQ